MEHTADLFWVFSKSDHESFLIVKLLTVVTITS